MSNNSNSILYLVYKFPERSNWAKGQNKQKASVNEQCEAKMKWLWLLSNLALTVWLKIVLLH